MTENNYLDSTNVLDSTEVLVKMVLTPSEPLGMGPASLRPFPYTLNWLQVPPGHVPQPGAFIYLFSSLGNKVTIMPTFVVLMNKVTVPSCGEVLMSAHDPPSTAAPHDTPNPYHLPSPPH